VLRVTITSLRRKLGAPPVLENVPGKGYRLTLPENAFAKGPAAKSTVPENAPAKEAAAKPTVPENTPGKGFRL
jgi:DNA-binding winged helix-turn-helix (wHTH) protein